MTRDELWIEDLMTLKRLPRSGWFWVGVERPESVAEHSYATGLLAWRLAGREGLDAQRCLLMGLLHDFHEIRLGDIPRPFKSILGEERISEAEAAVEREQWEDEGVLELLEELRQGESPEARLVHAVDELEMLLQGLRYLRAGNREAATFLEGARKGRAASHPATADLAASILQRAGL